MKFLGIDFGTKRIGVAVSDENNTLAFPKEILLNNTNIFIELGRIIRGEDISEIVIGESVDLSGKLNPLATNVEIFISELEDRFKLPVHKQKEFLTSVEARKAGKTKASFQKSQAHSKIKKEKGGKVDASAAALILQRYLDKKNLDISNRPLDLL